MIPKRLDFPCTTNADYTEELSFQVDTDYVQLGGYSFAIHVQQSPNSALTLHEFTTVMASTSEGIFIVDPAYGAISLRFSWETLKTMYEDVYPAYLEGDKVALYYDCQVTLPGGDKETWLYGYFNIERGITNG